MDRQRIAVWLGAAAVGAGCGYLVESSINFYGGNPVWVGFFVLSSVAAAILRTIEHQLLAGMAVGGLSMFALFLITFFEGQMGNGYEKFFVPGMVIWSLYGTIFGLVSGLIAAGLWRVVCSGLQPQNPAG